MNEENEVNQQQIFKILKAQLSHSDGIRGFFVSYLTSPEEVEGNEIDDIADDDVVVSPTLIAAMEVANKEELIPLACKNIVMPTGMITMHKDPEQSSESRKTAQRGKKVLASLRALSSSHNEDIVKSCRAIHAVATSENKDLQKDIDHEEHEIKYWTGFFKKWGYENRQKKDIAEAISEFL